MHEPIAKLRAAVASVYLGNPAAIDRLLVCLLARGHCLIEDVPGVGKTLLASALARGIDASFSRLQLTPDLLPNDILGVSVYRRETDRFEFKPGPIFANIVLADEINRATPRTQTALLEAMNDAAISIDGHTHKLAPPFMLVATQNPSDFEGTFPLPENQLDRFLMRLTLGYPSPADEARVLAQRPAAVALPQMAPVLHAQDIIALQARVDATRLDQALIDYIIALANATRKHEALELGLSPRGSLALAQAARATAVLAGRDYVVPEDILGNVKPVCAHRMLARSTGLLDQGDTTARVLEQLVETVPSPV
jgi:MoxR-like ATPase